MFSMEYQAASVVPRRLTLLDAAWSGCDIRLWVIFGCIRNEPLLGDQPTATPDRHRGGAGQSTETG
jgi:hypothetical protein